MNINVLLTQKNRNKTGFPFKTNKTGFPFKTDKTNKTGYMNINVDAQTGFRVNTRFPS